MVRRTLVTIGLAAVHAAALLLSPSTASAQTPPSAEPSLHHAPVSVAKAGEQLSILAGIDHP